jgi:hypothetical protein
MNENNEEPSKDEEAKTERLQTIKFLVRKMKQFRGRKYWISQLTCPICSGVLGLTYQPIDDHVRVQCATDWCDVSWIE